MTKKAGDRAADWVARYEQRVAAHRSAQLPAPARQPWPTPKPAHVIRVLAALLAFLLWFAWRHPTMVWS